MTYDIIGSVFYTPPANGIVREAELNIGVVAIRRAHDKTKWRAFIGFGTTGSEDADEQLVAAHGTALKKEIAIAYFPSLKPGDFER